MLVARVLSTTGRAFRAKAPIRIDWAGVIRQSRSRIPIIVQ